MTVMEFITIIGTLAAVFSLGYKLGEEHNKSDRPQSKKR
jgi:hypothetical protein